MAAPDRITHRAMPGRRYRNVERRLRRRYGHRLPKGRPKLGTRLRRVLWSWWPWAGLAALLLIMDRFGSATAAAITAFACHLIAPREFGPTYGLDHEFSTDAEEFKSSMVGATGVPFVEGNQLDIYNNGDEFYPVMLESIRYAEASVTVEAYIYWAGDVGQRFAQAFADRARAGIKVKILLDAIGSSSIGEDILRTLTESGCQIAWFNPIHWYTLGRFNNRTHRKSLIIDGRVAFTGGAGIADHWIGVAQDPEHWRDMQIRIQGPGVLPLQTGFAHNWLQTTGELVSGNEYYQPLEPAGQVTLQTLLSSPVTGASAVRIMYYLAIVSARRYIYIANPYFVPDQAAIDILNAAKKRGVDVKIMISGTYNDSRLGRYNGRRLYGALLVSGIEIYEFNRTNLHHKIMVIDDAWGTVGTANFDNRSFAHNEESNVSFYDPVATEKLRNTFLQDMGGCNRVSLADWRNRGLPSKLMERAMSLLEDQV